MNFIEEICSKLTKDYGLSVLDYRLINISGKCLYIEGHNGIKLLAEDEIQFHLKKKILIIKGENLSIQYFDTNTASVEGNIVQTSVLNSN